MSNNDSFKGYHSKSEMRREEIMNDSRPFSLFERTVQELAEAKAEIERLKAEIAKLRGEK